MKAVILFSVFAVAFARECGENQHDESCGTACPQTCENYKNPPKFCVLMCNPGCHCDEGYVRTKDGRCVEPEKCPTQAECGENKRFLQCGTACPLTCDNYKNPPKFCPAMCVSGCHCKRGFVKTRDGQCVRPENCPAKSSECGENKRFLQCGTACPLTCDNYKNPPKFCPAMCVSGCHCKRGYVKTREGQCVKPGNCPVKSSAAAKVCNLPVETGMCRGYMKRFYYETVSGTCKKFIYGGCGGNENNFATLEECKKMCDK